jgi:hypothetical protein
MANDPRVAEKALDLIFAVGCNLLDVPLVEGAAEASRLRRMVSQERPDWNDSKTSISNSSPSSCIGRDARLVSHRRGLDR